MFTGIITAMGRIVSLTHNDFGVRLVVDPCQPKDWPAFPKPGDSVAVQGCCLTLAPKSSDPAGCLGFDLIRETLEKTSLGRRPPGARVNLELSLTPMTAMGGHFVQGHIDGTGVVVDVKADETQYVITVETPGAPGALGAPGAPGAPAGTQAATSMTPYFVPKGSVTIDGVSLTLAAVDAPARRFSVALIPTTLERTTLGELKAGDTVNLECDVIAKTVVHWLSLQKAAKAEKVDVGVLRAAGFVGE